jgi:hypothetical protein
VILASHYGWQTLFPDQQPDFHDLLLMAQLISEERVGRHARAKAGTSAAQESDRLQRLRQFSG